MDNLSSSIFTIERRKKFPEAFNHFFEDLKTIVINSKGKHYSMFEYLNRCLRYWPHRCGAISIDGYLKDIGVDITDPKNDKDLLLALELLINLLKWVPEQYSNDYYSGFSTELKNVVEDEAERLLENAEYLLEQCCNMTVREEDDDVFPMYFITKRNAQVDSAIIAAPELKNTLLGYLDIRNADDYKYKKSALNTIYGYMEPHRKEYKAIACSSVSEEFFTSMNTFGIRHNTKSQIRLQTNKKKSVCDKLFLMSVFVLQTSEVNNYKNELKTIREEHKSK